MRSVGLGLAGAAALGITTVHANEDSIHPGHFPWDHEGFFRQSLDFFSNFGIKVEF